MTLPEIPDEAWEAAGIEFDPTVFSHLTDAWPHLYAAALRHAASLADDGAHWPRFPADYLRRLADEAVA